MGYRHRPEPLAHIWRLPTSVGWVPSEPPENRPLTRSSGAQVPSCRPDCLSGVLAGHPDKGLVWWGRGCRSVYQEASGCESSGTGSDLARTDVALWEMVRR
jgi:hypothetical protein